MNNLKEKLTLTLKELKEKSNYRELKNYNREFIINFSSNDYLNLDRDSKLKESFFKTLSVKDSFGSSGSRLLNGNYREVLEFEESINKVFKKDSLVINSGYDANLLILETFFNKNDVIFTDRLNHNSIYKGIINSGAKIIRYNHLDVNDLERKLKKYRDRYENTLIISESIYSMDGDLADINKLVQLKKEFNSYLMIDESHSYIVKGYGLAYNLNLVEDIEFIMFGLGKGGASSGGVIILDRLFKEFIVNRGSHFIYTTSPSPIVTKWNHFIFNKIDSLGEKEKDLNSLKGWFINSLKEKGIKTISTEQIVSIIIGENHKAIKLAESLKDKGYLVYPIKEPTVPPKTARIRLSLNVGMKKENLKEFIEVLNEEINNIL